VVHRGARNRAKPPAAGCGAVRGLLGAGALGVEACLCCCCDGVSSRNGVGVWLQAVVGFVRGVRGGLCKIVESCVSARWSRVHGQKGGVVLASLGVSLLSIVARYDLVGRMGCCGLLGRELRWRLQERVSGGRRVWLGRARGAHEGSWCRHCLGQLGASGYDDGAISGGARGGYGWRVSWRRGVRVVRDGGDVRSGREGQASLGRDTGAYSYGVQGGPGRPQSGGGGGVGGDGAVVSVGSRAVGW